MLMGMGLGRMGGTAVNVDAQGRIILRTKATDKQVFAVDVNGGYNWAPLGLATHVVDTDSLPEKQRGMYFWMTSHPDYQVADVDRSSALPDYASWEQIGAQDTASTGKWLSDHQITTGAAVNAAIARGDVVAPAAVDIVAGKSTPDIRQWGGTSVDPVVQTMIGAGGGQASPGVMPTTPSVPVWVWGVAAVGAFFVLKHR